MNDIFIPIPPILLKKIIIWDDNNCILKECFYFNDSFKTLNELDKFIKDKFKFWHNQKFLVLAEYIINPCS